jgi:hypothetical protein
MTISRGDVQLYENIVAFPLMAAYYKNMQFY